MANAVLTYTYVTHTDDAVAMVIEYFFASNAVKLLVRQKLRRHILK